MSSIATTHRAAVVLEKGKIHVVERSLPVVGDDHVLIKVRAVALNPTDWRHVDGILKPGASVGCDFSGDIVEIGKAAQDKGFHVGDAVAGFVHGGVPDNNNGAFQEYVRALPDVLWPKPTNLSYEDASGMGGVALSTAMQALYYRLNVPKPWELQPTSEKPATILIWSGATSVGLFAIALAKLSGLTVVTTASPKNQELVKSRGADKVFSHRDHDVSQQIREWGEQHGEITIALDCISDKGTTKHVVESFGKHGGDVVTLLPVKKHDDWPDNIRFHTGFIHGALLPQNQKDFADMLEWYKHLPLLVKSGKLKNQIPLKIWKGGIDSIDEALDYLRKGKTSGEKVVLTF